MSGFADEAQVHVKAGDGGAGSVSFRREAHVSKGGPDGGDGGDGGDVWLVATTNQASLLGFRDHPHRRATDGKHGQGKRSPWPPGPALEVPVPGGNDRPRSRRCHCSPIWPRAGDRWLAARGGQGRQGQRPVPDQPPTGSGLRRAGREGRGALARPRAQAAGRRGAGRLAQLRQEHPDLAHLGRQAQGGRLSVHHPRAPSGRGPGGSLGRRGRVRGGRRPGPGRGGSARPGSRAPVPAPRRAGPGHRWCSSTSPPPTGWPCRSSSGSCWPSSAATDRNCSNDPACSWDPSPTSPRARRGRGRRSPSRP